MALIEIWDRFTVGGVAGWGLVILIILLTLIQISPLKVNPWDKILGWFGRKLNGASEKQMAEVQKQVTDLWISSHRMSILNFARECREKAEHDAEEWSNILNICAEYEKYTEENGVSNGVVHENTRYIRDLYQELSHEHKI